jgi:hypothetical protein
VRFNGAFVNFMTTCTAIIGLSRISSSVDSSLQGYIDLDAFLRRASRCGWFHSCEGWASGTKIARIDISVATAAGFSIITGTIHGEIDHE